MKKTNKTEQLEMFDKKIKMAAKNCKRWVSLMWTCVPLLVACLIATVVGFVSQNPTLGFSFVGGSIASVGTMCASFIAAYKYSCKEEDLREEKRLAEVELGLVKDEEVTAEKTATTTKAPKSKKAAKEADETVVEEVNTSITD